MCFYLNDFVCSLENNQNVFDVDVFNKLEALCRKIDVVGKLFIQYTESLNRRTTDIELNPRTYLSLYDILLSAFSQNRDYKYLNTLFKLNDALMNKNIVSSRLHSENEEKLVQMFHLIES